MRLLNASTFHLESFFNESTIPRYAILSHTWGVGEVTFQTLEHLHTLPQSSKERALITASNGFYKIRKCCQQALADGLEYAWVDTCCIDKTSSAELSEAINSMFKWYKNADVCYAYLEDVRYPGGRSGGEILTDALVDRRARPKDSNPELMDELRLGEAKWFTRGWTLQELIAPGEVRFFARGWNVLGRKTKMVEVLTGITGIDQHSLQGRSLEYISISQRMSWASQRETTRTEDLAYCLLGIFNVNMPLLYGEGPKAFARLQEEIMKDSDDQSLFAWVPTSVSLPSPIVDLRHQFPDYRSPPDLWKRSDKPPPSARSENVRGAFATHPSEFSTLPTLKVNNWTFPLKDLSTDHPFSSTNKGIEMELPILALDDGYLVLVVLNCVDSGSSLIGIVTQAEDGRLVHLSRLDGYGLVRVEKKILREKGCTRKVYLSKKGLARERG